MFIPIMYDTYDLVWALCGCFVNGMVVQEIDLVLSMYEDKPPDLAPPY